MTSAVSDQSQFTLRIRRSNVLCASFLWISRKRGKYRLRAVSYFSLQSYCTRNLSTRAAKPRAARNEGVSLVWSQSLIVIITSWFAIALDEIRTRRILREKADCKQSTENMAEDALRKEWEVFGLERLSKHQEEALRLLG